MEGLDAVKERVDMGLAEIFGLQCLNHGVERVRSDQGSVVVLNTALAIEVVVESVEWEDFRYVAVLGRPRTNLEVALVFVCLAQLVQQPIISESTRHLIPVE